MTHEEILAAKDERIAELKSVTDHLAAQLTDLTEVRAGDTATINALRELAERRQYAIAGLEEDNILLRVCVFVLVAVAAALLAVAANGGF